MNKKGKLVMYLKGGKQVVIFDAAVDDMNGGWGIAYSSLTTFTADLPRTTRPSGAFAYTPSLRRFYGKLPALQDGNIMFRSRYLDSKSIKIILSSIPKWTSGSHSLNIGFRRDWKDDQEIAKMLGTTTPIAAGTYRCYEIKEDGTVGADKGWTVTVS